MATNNFLNMLGDPARRRRRCGCASDVLGTARRTASSSSFGVRHARRRASTCSASCRSSSCASASGCSRTRSTASASSARSTCRRAGRRCSSAITCRMSTALLVGACDAALRPLPRLQAVLRALGGQSAAAHAARDSDRRGPRGGGGDRRRARSELAGRPRRLHLRGRVRSAAPATCCRSSAASSGSSTASTCPIIPVYLDRVWGSIFSFKGGRFFWKLAGARALSGDGRVRRAAAVDDDRPPKCGSRCMDARRRGRGAAPRPADEVLGRQFIADGEAPLAVVLHGRLDTASR